MMAKLTKAAGRRRMKEIESKMFRLYEAGFVSLKDVEAVKKICKTRSNQLR
tara:strand:- start:105 stop:257 length:153 start_codon:yes stop_codon:yes gene_type:complete